MSAFNPGLFTAAVGLGLAVPLAACSGDFPCDPEAPGTICTIVGSGESAFGGDDGPALQAPLYTPQDTARAPNGNLWVIDFNNYLIREVKPDGIIHTVIGNGLLGDSPSDTNATEWPALQAKMNHTPSMMFHDGYLYMAAWHNSRVKRVDLSTMMVENFAGAGRRTYYTGDEGPALRAALDLPSSLAVDPDGNILIMDQANQVIRSVDRDGIIHRVVGTCVVELRGEEGGKCEEGEEPFQCLGSNKTTCSATPEIACSQPCSLGYGGDGGSALDARLAQPFGQSAYPAGRMAYDAEGNLYFADSANHRIRMVDTAGIIHTVAGTGDQGYGGDGGPATEAYINTPVDIDVAPDGSVFFTDTFNSCIRKIDPDSGVISTVVGQCSPRKADWGFDGDGGHPEDALLNRPFGLQVDGPDRLIVTDSYNERIRVVNF